MLHTTSCKSSNNCLFHPYLYMSPIIIKKNISLQCLLSGSIPNINRGAFVVVILYVSWIYNYLCNQYLSPIMLRVRIPLRRGVLDATLCNIVCQWLVTGRWFFPGIPVSSTNTTDRHDITEILLKVTLNIITLNLILIY